MEKSRKRKRASVPLALASRGWKKVEVGDELLLGSEEGGFLELEELTPAAAGSNEAAAADAADDTGEHTATAAAPAVKPEKQKKGSAKTSPKHTVMKTSEALKAVKKGKAKAAKSSGGACADLDGLKAKIAALQQENAALKGGHSETPKQEKHIPADPNSARSRKLAAKKAKAREVRNAKKQAAKARKLRAAERAQQHTGKPVPANHARDYAALRAGEPKPGKAQATAGQASLQAAAATDGMLAWQGLGLGPRVIAAIAALGFEEPTPIQRDCMLPAIRDRRDIIGAAQTGSGKTLAFGLPILQLLHSEAPAAGADAPLADPRQAGASPETLNPNPDVKERQGPPAAPGHIPLRALILEPTRELAMQVCEHMQRVAKPLGVWVAPILGGISPAKQTRLLGRQPQVIVATPGRLWELMRLGEPHLADLSHVTCLVLDEADRMVQQGHFQELSNILETLASQRASSGAAADDADLAEEADSEDDVDADAARDDVSSKKGPSELLQTFVFSATLTLPQKLRKRLRRGGGASGSMMLKDLMDKVGFRGKPKIVDLTSQRKLADKIEEATLHCGDEERDELLYYIMATHPGRTLVFSNAVSTARRVAALLHILKLPSAALHAGMQQRARLKALDRFRSSDNAVLVASDVAARGLDVTGVRCVVHYQIPASVDIYVHRSGRTARGDADGLAIALVAPKEAPRYAALQQALDRPEPPAFPLNAALLPACRQRVKLAVRLDALLRVQSKAHAEKSWKQRNAEAMDMEVSDDENDDGEPPATKKPRRQQASDSSSAVQLQKELDELLAQPLQASFSRRFFTGVPSASLAANPAAKPRASAQPQVAATAPAEGFQDRAASGAEGALEAVEDMSQDAQQHQQQREREQGLKQTVALAQTLANSRQRSKGTQRGGAVPLKRAAKGAAKKSKQELEQDALAAALERRQRSRQKGGTLAAAAMDRNVSGPDALEAVRQARLAAL